MVNDKTTLNNVPLTSSSISVSQMSLCLSVHNKGTTGWKVFHTLFPYPSPPLSLCWMNAPLCGSKAQVLGPSSIFHHPAKLVNCAILHIDILQPFSFCIICLSHQPECEFQEGRNMSFYFFIHLWEGDLWKSVRKWVLCQTYLDMNRSSDINCVPLNFLVLHLLIYKIGANP